jgi:hypothetical protein
VIAGRIVSRRFGAAGRAAWGLFLGAATGVGAQTLNPPIAIYQGTAHGSLIIANPTINRMNFVLEPMSFTTSITGDITFQPLDTSRIRLTLSAMSGRIPARQSYRIFYEASSDSIPSWFAIVATFSRGAPTSGLVVRMQLPQMVYLTQRDPAVAADLGLDSVSYDSVSQLVYARVTNRSSRLTRLLALKVVPASGATVAFAAGPIFPDHTQEYVLRWTRAERPLAVVADFPGFSLTGSIVRSVAAPPKPRVPRVPRLRLH